MLQVTEDAAVAVRWLTRQAGAHGDGGLRISANGPDCAQVHVEIVAAPRPEDLVVTDRGCRVFLDADAAVLIAGMTLDFDSGAMRPTFFLVVQFWEDDDLDDGWCVNVDPRLAEIEDELRRSDPLLAASFDGFPPAAEDGGTPDERCSGP